MSNRRCPRCQATYAAPARFCVKDGSLLVESDKPPATNEKSPLPGLEGLVPHFGRSLGARTWTQGAGPSSLASLTGQVLDQRYQITRKLGEGGMSYVYQAQEIETGRAVAVKILIPRLSRDPASVERLRREATIATRLNHPNVCPILRMGETADRLIYLVMPYLEGEPLSEHETRRGPFPLAEGIPLLVQMCRGAGARARPPDHPSRSQARERDAGARSRDSDRLSRGGDGLRPGQGEARRPRRREADGHRHRAGHAGVHEPGADPGQAAGRPERRVRAGRFWRSSCSPGSCRLPGRARRRP